MSYILVRTNFFRAEKLITFFVCAEPYTHRNI